MLNEIEVTEIVNGVLNIEKKQPTLLKKDKGIEYYPNYLLNVEAMNEIKVHSVRGTYPERIISSRAPNMTDIEKRYVAENYKQITLPVYVDFMNTIKRAFSDNNWSLDFPDDDGQEGSFRHYVDKGIASTKIKMSIEAYIKNVVPSVKIIDSMGCIVVKPERIKTDTVDGELVMGSDLLDPIPQYYSCEQLKAYDESNWYLFLTNEYSVVSVGNRKEQTGFVYELYDKNTIYRIYQVGAKKDNNFEVEVYFEHEQNSTPVKRLEGIPEYRDGAIHWMSPFSYAVPILDDAIIDANMLRGVKATTMFPYRVMVGNICEHKLDLGGEIKCCDGRGWFDDFDHNTVVKCPGCGGSGLRDRVSPYGVMLMKPESPGDQGELKATQPSMYYVSPPTDVPQFIRTEVSHHMAEARRILHVRESSTQVKGAEDMTATGMVIDEKALYSFIKPISDQIFEMYEFILNWIAVMRYGEQKLFELVAPITFDFKTEYDYLMEISVAIKNGLPPFVVHTIIIKYLRTLFYNQLESAKAFNVIVRSDRLLTMDDDEVALKLSKGLIAGWEVILHDSAVSFVMELNAENPRFFDQDEQVQIDQLIEKAKEKANEMPQLNPLSPQNIVDTIVNGNA